MIITEYVKISISNRNRNYYSELGYCVTDIKELIVNVCDLTHSCNEKVMVECDVCSIQKELSYVKYNKNINNGGYYSCSNKCSVSKRTNTNLLIYGYDNPAKSELVKSKMRETNLRIRGVEYPSQCAKVKEKMLETNLLIYGYDNPAKSESVKSKMRETNLRIRGVEYPSQYEICREKMRRTNEILYGVEYPLQNAEIFSKQQRSSFKILNYIDDIDDITYQGTYELDFLNNYYASLNITNAPIVNYKLNGGKHVYHPDFYIPEFNLIVEIKSSYTYEYDLEMNISKQNQCIEDGYNFIFIIDKDYTEFNNLYNEKRPTFL